MRYQGPRCEIIERCYQCRYCIIFAGIDDYCVHEEMRGPKKLRDADEIPPNWCPLERWHE